MYLMDTGFGQGEGLYFNQYREDMAKIYALEDLTLAGGGRLKEKDLHSAK